MANTRELNRHLDRITALETENAIQARDIASLSSRVKVLEEARKAAAKAASTRARKAAATRKSRAKADSK